jgi:hypothetical protein
MSDRRALLDEPDDAVAGVCGALGQLRAGAHAAGYDTASPAVQAALLTAYGMMSAASVFAGQAERITDELRRARKDSGGRYS